MASILATRHPPDVDVVFTLFERRASYPFSGRLYTLGEGAGRLSRYLEFRRILEREKPDMVLSFLNKAHPMNLLMTPGKRAIRIDYYPQRPLLRDMYSRLAYWLKTRMLYRRADRVLVASEPIRRFFVDRYGLDPRRVRLAYNPCDVRAVRRAAGEEIEEKYAELTQGPLIITVGRLVWLKGQWHLVRAFRRVASEIPDARLVIWGEGGLRGYIEELIHRLELKDKVHLLGWMGNPFKYMAGAELFCLTSLHEGFANVVVEALACGLPVMSADCLSGPREILAPGTAYRESELREPEYAEYGVLMPVMDGRLYPPQAPLTWQEKIWAEEIINLLQDRKRLAEYRAKAPGRAMSFDVEVQVKRFMDELREAL